MLCVRASLQILFTVQAYTYCVFMFLTRLYHDLITELVYHPHKSVCRSTSHWYLLSLVECDQQFFLTNLLELIEWRFCFHNKICPFDLKRGHGRVLYSSCFINVAGFFLHKMLYTCFRKVKCRIKKHESLNLCVLIDTIVLR